MKIAGGPYSKTLYVWNSVSAVFFYGGLTPPHSHNTIQLVFDIRKAFKCRIENKEWGVYKSVIIKENVIHQLDTNDSVQLLLYLDAECEIAKAIKLKYLSGSDICSPGLDVLDHANPGELEHCLIDPNPELLQQLVLHLLNQLIDNQKKDLSDERVKKVIKLLAIDSSGKITIPFLAKEVFISESRLRFLFKRATGVPLHRYIIWNRIMLAIGKIMNGSTVQNAAIDCGFTDSSHFHKLLSQMFGVSPSQFIKDNSKKSLQILTRYPMNMESRVFDDERSNTNRIYKI